MFNYILNLWKNNDRRFYYLSLLLENNQWTIHGLWPQNSKSDYPTFCRRVDFSENLLNPIIDDLDKYWHSDRGSNENFWEHEWKKHGSCMFQEMDELQYFSKTLELFHYVRKKGIINNFKCRNQALIPFSLDFKLI